MPSVGGVPSVTEILRAVGLTASYAALPESVRTTASQKGQALHAALALHAAGTLEEGSLHPALRPGFEAYLRFVRDQEHAALAAPEIDERELAIVDTDVIEHPAGDPRR